VRALLILCAVCRSVLSLSATAIQSEAHCSRCTHTAHCSNVFRFTGTNPRVLDLLVIELFDTRAAATAHPTMPSWLLAT
jgi:hypothetical protein